MNHFGIFFYKSTILIFHRKEKAVKEREDII